MSKKIPKFKSEDEEREFWAAHDSTEYVDWKNTKRVFLASLKPSLKTISPQAAGIHDRGIKAPRP